MPSILSGCLILLKIAMAVNDGLHSMLSSIYSIIETVINSDCDVEPLQETDSAPVILCSKSRILEAFNRRRANAELSEKTEVYVTNLNPYQEITITNKDFDGRRKLTSTMVKKPHSKRAGIQHNGVQTGVNISSPCSGDSESLTPSSVSSDTGNESEYHPCKNVSDSDEQKKNECDLCLENETVSVNFSENSNESAFIREGESPTSNASFLRDLQKQLQFTGHTLLGALSNIKNPVTDNVYGLTDSDTINNAESTSSKVHPDSSLKISESRKEFLEETARLYEGFLQNFYQKQRDTRANLRDVSNKGGPNTEITMLKESEPAMEGKSLEMNNATSILTNKSEHVSNHVASIDYHAYQTHSRIGYFSYSKPATKLVNSFQIPLSLRKDRWTEMEDIEHLEDKASKHHHASETLKPFLKSCRQSSDDESIEDYDSSESDNEFSPKTCQAFFKRDSYSIPTSSLEEFDSAGDFDGVTLARIELLKSVLQEVGATDVLEDLNWNNHKPDSQGVLDFGCQLFNQEKSLPPKGNEDLKTNGIKSSPKKTNLINLDCIPFKELNSEEKQIDFLNDLTESYRQKNRQNELYENFEDCHKVMLDSITNAYKNKLDLITKKAGMCQDELFSINTDLEAKFGSSKIVLEDNSNKDTRRTCVSNQTSTLENMPLAVGQPSVVIPSKNTGEPLEVVESESLTNTVASFRSGLFDTSSDCGTEISVMFTDTDTSTPIKDEKIDQIWVSINLSSGSIKESCVNEDKYINSAIYDYSLQNNALCEYVKADLLNNRQEVTSSPLLKEDISIAAKDWGILAEQMSYNYEKVVSLLNSIDDGENFGPKKDSTCFKSEDFNTETNAIEIEQNSVLCCNKNIEHSKINESCKCKGTNASKSNSNCTNSSGKSNFNANRITNSYTDSTSESGDHESDQLENDKIFSEVQNSSLEDLRRVELHTTRVENLLKETESVKNFESSHCEVESQVVSENCSGNRTPESKFEEMIRREELETVQIYDDFHVYDKNKS